MSDMPERIWLTEIEDEGVDWCEDKINEDDVEYVRADLVAENARNAERISLLNQSCLDYEIGLRDKAIAAKDAEIARLTAELVSANNEVDALREDLMEDW